MSLLNRITKSENLATTTLIRILVGSVFLSEGIQKFRFSESGGHCSMDTSLLPNLRTNLNVKSP